MTLQNVRKSFGATKAVDGVSFDVKKGEIFGLIGANGSGKTTILRMVMGMLMPDGGRIGLFGNGRSDADNNRIGYLPEERGLYKDLTVEQTIHYLASLKGVDGREAVEKAYDLLDSLGQPIEGSKKIKELSHGMAQLVQLTVTVVHNPELVVLDEPFAGLDPVKCELFKDVIKKIGSAGNTVLMSTHRMEEIEALCGRIFMIDKGKEVVYGGVKEIKERHNKGIVRVSADGALGGLQGVISQYEQDGYKKLVLGKGVLPEYVLGQMIDRKLRIREFAVELPTMQEIFVDLVGGER